MMEPKQLTRLSGLTLIAAGLSYLPVVLLGGWRGIEDIGGTNWWIVYSLATGHHFLLLFGLFGIFAAQLRQAGVFSLIALVVANLGNVAVAGVGIVQLTLLPALAGNEQAGAGLICTPFYPAATAAAAGFIETACTDWDFASLTGWVLSSWLTFMLGSILVGVAIARAGVLPRAAGGLLAAGWIVQLAGLPFSWPVLVANLSYLAIIAAYVWLGSSLWTNPR